MKKTAIITTAIVAIFLFASLAMAGVAATTNKGFIGAFAKEDLKSAISYISAKDYDAFQSLLDDTKVFQLKAGLKVFIEKTSWGLAKIRPKGETFTFWVNTEAVTMD